MRPYSPSMFGRGRSYSIETDRALFRAIPTGALEFLSSSSWHLRSWTLAATSESMAVSRSPFSSDAFACPSSRLYRSAQALESSRECTAAVKLGPSAHSHGRPAMDPAAIAETNNTVVPKRMAPGLLQGRSPARRGIKAWWMYFALRIGSAFAQELGRGEVRESRVVKNGVQPYVYSGDSSVGRVVEGLIVLRE